MGGKPCIRGLRVTVGTVVGLMAAGHSPEKILQSYPYLELEDIYEALTLFGSVLQDDLCPDSDIDLLVTFKPDAKRGLTETLQI